METYIIDKPVNQADAIGDPYLSIDRPLSRLTTLSGFSQVE